MRRIIDHTHRTAFLLIAIVLAISLPAVSSFAQGDADAGAPGEWLSQYLTARTAGFGGAFTATADQSLGVLWNPAGLSFMSRNQVQLETARYFEDTGVNSLSLALPGRRLPSFGVTLLNLSSGSFEKTNDLNQSLGEFSEGDLVFMLSAAKSFTPRLSVGTNVKIIRQSIDEFDAAGFGFDVGGIFAVTPALRLGVSVQNIGGPNLALRAEDETFPLEVRGGVALQIFGGRGLVSMDVDHRDGPGTRFAAGTEFWVHNVMALRVGYASESASGGFSYKASPQFSFDYAATDNQELGLTHRLGISYDFGGFFASSNAVPSVFSPIGQNSVTKINLTAKTKAEPRSWTLAISNKSGETVRKFSGKGAPPAHVMWDGKSESGLPLADGSYKYRLTVIDEYGRETVGNERVVEITTEGPQGSVPVYTD